MTHKFYLLVVGDTIEIYGGNETIVYKTPPTYHLPTYHLSNGNALSLDYFIYHKHYEATYLNRVKS